MYTEKRSIFKKWCWSNWMFERRRMQTFTYLSSYIKLQSALIQHLSILIGVSDSFASSWDCFLPLGHLIQPEYEGLCLVLLYLVVLHSLVIS